MRAVSLSRLLRWALPLLLAIAVFAFWRFAYPHALAYQEQFQLFLLTSDYFFGRLAVPGGLACYVSETIVQFYNNVTLGALLLAAIYVFLQQLLWSLMRREGCSADSLFWLAVSFVPSLLLWFLMGDPNVMLSFAVALIFVLLTWRLWPTSRIAQWCFIALATPLVYWLAGPVVLLLPLALLFKKPLQGIIALLYAIVLIVLSSYVAPYPLARLFRGIFYYRYPEVFSFVMLAIVVLCSLLPRLSAKPIASRLLGWGAVAVCALLGAFLVPLGFDAKTYELIDYDYLVRLHRWDAIIDKATRQQPDLPMSVCATDLALGMTGQLGDRAFDFYQNGVQGLLPPFVKNFSSQLITAEAYYELGAINTAQRFAFETMECLPNYNKSARVVKRLAETNLINGQYGVARKYLDMLENTIFYRKWAQRTRKLLGNETAIRQHEVYGRLRKSRLQNDFLFSEGERDKVIGQLFMQNPNNQLACQYLLLCPLLEGNLPKFVNYYSAVMNARRYAPYNPTVAQQGMAFAFFQQRQQPPQGTVSPAVMQHFSDFVNIYMREGKNSPQLQLFRNTLWYYLVSESTGKEAQQ